MLDAVASTSVLFRRPLEGVAIVRLDNIGDFVLWLGSIEALLKNFKEYPVTLIANSKWSELAEKLPFWRNVIAVDTLRFSTDLVYRFSFLHRISKAGFEIAIQPVYSRNLAGDTVIRSTRAKERIGSVGDCSNIQPWQKRISDGWYTRLLAANSAPMMELERNAEFVRAIGNSDFRSRLPVLPKVSELSMALRVGQPYFIVFPGASWSGKQWPTKNYGTLIDRIFLQTGWQAVLCGSQEEQQLCADIAVSTTCQTQNMAGKTSLNDLVEVIREAEFLVGNDTSAVHIASAVGTPSICIVGGGHFGRFVPYGKESRRTGVPPLPVFHTMDCFWCNWQCTQPYEPGQAVPCIAKIEVAQVLEGVTKVLGPEFFTARNLH